MNTYKAYVRVPFGNSTTVVETVVHANDSNSAVFLLQAQFGRENVIGNPLQVQADM